MNDQLKHYQIFFLAVRDHSSGSTLSACGSSSSSFVSEDRFVHAIVAFKSGFLCSLGIGKVAVFELVKPLKTLRADDEILFKGKDQGSLETYSQH